MNRGESHQFSQCLHVWRQQQGIVGKTNAQWVNLVVDKPQLLSHEGHPKLGTGQDILFQAVSWYT